MKLEAFFDKFEFLAETPNAVHKLRKLILQLAVMGKLVPQNPDDEPASVLLDKIKFEKEWLVKEGKIRRDKEIPLIEKQNLPLNLPQTWKWSNINDVAFLVTDGEHATPSRIIKPEIPLVTAKNVRDGYLDLTNTDFVSYATAAKCWQRCEPMHNDILMVCVGATIGRLCLIKEPPKFTMVRSVSLIRPFENYIYAEYMAVAIKSPLGQSQIWSKVKQSAQPCLYINKIQSLAIPIPPLPEQERIVAKVDELMSLCDELEKRQKKKRETCVLLNNAAINQLLTAPEPDIFAKHWQRICDNFDLLYSAPENIGKLRQTILQLAVMGKLVPQDPNDEPASVLLEKIKAEKERLLKEKKIDKPELLPSIRNDDKPFYLPKDWEWVYLGQISNAIHYGYTASANQNLKEVRLLRITDIQNNRVNWASVPGCEIDENKLQGCQLNNGDLLIARTGGTIGKSYLVEDLSVCAVFASYLIRVIPPSPLLPKYLKLFLESETYWKQLYAKSMGTGQPNVNATSLKSLIVPLPSFQEQKRIVAKVDQLMSLCDELEAKLTQSQTDSEKLMDAAVRQLLVM